MRRMRGLRRWCWFEGGGRGWRGRGFERRWKGFGNGEVRWVYQKTDCAMYRHSALLSEILSSVRLRSLHMLRSAVFSIIQPFPAVVVLCSARQCHCTALVQFTYTYHRYSSVLFNLRILHQQGNPTIPMVGNTLHDEPCSATNSTPTLPC